MKITALETIQLGEFPNLCFVRLHTDEGLVGLGETFFGATEVASYLHETAAPRLLGQDASAIDALRVRLQNYVGTRSTGVETRGNSAVDLALWDLAGKATGRPVHQLPRGRRSARTTPAPATATSGRRPGPACRTGGCRQPRRGAVPTRTSTRGSTGGPASWPRASSSRASPG